MNTPTNETPARGGRGSNPSLRGDSHQASRPDVLDELYTFLGRFVAYPTVAARVAHALWIVHTFRMDLWDSTPRIAFLSPEPGSGKTRALEVSETVVPNPIEAINVTPAYLFRKVGDDETGSPTVLFDEIDTVFGPKARENEELRGLLNAGHRKGAVAGRCVVQGKTIRTEEIPAYCAVALAGIGGLPDTILSRSVVVRMRRRAPDEIIEPFRRRIHGPEGNDIGDRLAEWTRSITFDRWPEMPYGVEDRDADLWESLLAIADAAGGEWPSRARAACVALVAESKQSTPSLGIRLLEDLRTVFGDKDHMSTEDVIAGLCSLNEAPWGELRGKPINARSLARYVGKYGVKSRVVRIGDQTPRGYRREDLWDAWQRYIPLPMEAQQAQQTPQDPLPADPVAHVAHVAQPKAGGPSHPESFESLRPDHEQPDERDEETRRIAP